MSNKGNESEPLSVVEKVRNYPGISLESSKVSEATSSICYSKPTVTLSVTNSKAASPKLPTAKIITPVATPVPKKISVNAECRQINDKKKVVPPYTSFDRSVSQKSGQKSVAKPIACEKESVTVSSTTKTPPGDKKISNPQIIRSTVAKTSKINIMPVDKSNQNTVTGKEENSLVTKNASSENTNKTLEKSSPVAASARNPTTALEKNIQSNVISLTPHPNTTISKASPKNVQKDSKQPVSSETVPYISKTVTASSTTPNTKNPTQQSKPAANELFISKSVSVQSTGTDTSPKNTTRTATQMNNTSKTETVQEQKPATVANEIYISKAVSVQSTGTETSPKIMQRVVAQQAAANSTSKTEVVPAQSSVPKNVNSSETISKLNMKILSVTSTDSNTKNTDAKNIKVTPVRPKSIPKTIVNTSTSTPLTVQKISTRSDGASNSSSQVLLLKFQPNVIDALNSGSTVNYTDSVTISTPGLVTADMVLFQTSANLRSNSDSKVKNVSGETIVDKQNDPTSPSTSMKNKNGNMDTIKQNNVNTINASQSSLSSVESRSLKREITVPIIVSEDIDIKDTSLHLRRKLEEPECLTISSDEEAEGPEPCTSFSDNSDLSFSIMSKEPPIGKDEEAINKAICEESSVMEKELDDLLDITHEEGYVNLACRTVRIGSYKVVPRSSVTLSKYGVRIVVPPVNGGESVVLKIHMPEITKVLAHFNRTLPVMFFYIASSAGSKVRSALKMSESGSSYFDPSSDDESHRRITLLPEKFSEVNKDSILDLYETDLLDELTHKEANELLVRSSPKEIQKAMNKVPAPTPVQTIMVFPPPPTKGGISINTEDYSCLAEDVFLNDVIIDFYLKYLYLNELSEEDKQKTHIFSSFFYKRLTDKATPVPKFLQNSMSSDSKITPADIRHSRVKNWTKNIDIFSKDYIVIPLNENQHWFLAIICFPGLKGPVRFSDNKPLDSEISVKTEIKTESGEDNVESSEPGKTITIGSTTITPLRSADAGITVSDEDNEEDRDEADGADEDIDMFSSSEESDFGADPNYSDSEMDEVNQMKCRASKKKVDREPIKQPCILIFDSLAGASRTRIIATLRDYLRVEYKMKHKGEERDFSKLVVKGSCPRVPQQNNYTDCGLYVLQYVESFFKDKITDYQIPINLRKWFPCGRVSTKRYEIQQLLLRLMDEQNINVENLRLPPLNLTPRHRRPFYDTDDMDEFGEMDYDEEDEDDDDLDPGYVYENVEGNLRLSRLGHRRYIHEHELDDEGAFIDADDDDDGDEEMVLRHGSKYEMFESDEESGEMDGDSDDENSDECLYEDLNIREFRMQTYGRGSLIEEDEEEEEHIEEEDGEEEEEDEEKITNNKLNSLNKEVVTISKLPLVVVPTSSSSNSSGDQSSVVGTVTAAAGENKTKKSIEDLKKMRPWSKGSESGKESGSESGCSARKKSRMN